MGKGLGFDFKAGKELDETRIEKIFSIEPTRGYDNKYIKTLFANVPEDLLEICIGIIDKAKEVLNVKLNDSIYLTLTDHINFAITKALEKIDICSALTSEVKVFYPREYLIGKNALEAIKDSLDVSLPDGEACAIALHLVNAEYNTEIGSIVRITESIAEILTIISRQTGLEIKDDDVGGATFISFLKYFVFRVFTDNGMKDRLDDRFFLIIQDQYPDILQLSEKISRHLYAGSHRKLSKMDKAILSTNIYFFCEYTKRR